MENPTTYTTHTEITAANQLIIVQHPRATGIVAGQPYPLPPSANIRDVLHSNEHYSTYGTQHALTTNNSFARTSVQRAPTAITLFPLSTSTTTLFLEQCTSSCHTFPLRIAVGFIYVSTRNTITGGKIRIPVLPVPLPFRLATPPGFHVTRIPKGNLVPCTMSQPDQKPNPSPSPKNTGGGIRVRPKNLWAGVHGLYQIS